MIVVDASVLANAVADDEDAGDRCRTILRQGHDVAAPDLIDVEVASALRRRWLAGQLRADRFQRAVEDLIDFPCLRVPVLGILPRVFELRENVTAYDACYVALAESVDCVLWTADRRLARAPGPRCAVELVRS